MGYSPWGRKESDTTEQLHLLKKKKTRQNNTNVRYSDGGDSIWDRKRVQMDVLKSKLTGSLVG